MADLGRQVKYGIGKETTAGTAVAAAYWPNQLKFELNPSSDYATNESAFGVVEKQNDSTLMHLWEEGTLEAKLTPNAGGLVLLGAFGSISSATNADSSGTVKDHTMTINQNIAGQSLTLIRKDSLSTMAHALGRVGQWKLEMKLGDYVRYNADVMAKKGSSTTATPAYTAEAEFVAKHLNVKTAANVAGLSGASNLTGLESFTLTVDPNLEADLQAGSPDPYGFSSRGYEFTFEMEARYNDQTFENAYSNGTALALSVTALNTDVVIGTSANPKLVLTAPKMIITDWARNEDLDKPITQKLTGTLHYSNVDAYALKAVLTNTVASY